MAVSQSPLAYSNVRLLDPVTGRPTRAIFRYSAEGEKVGLLAAVRSASALPFNHVSAAAGQDHCW